MWVIGPPRFRSVRHSNLLEKRMSYCDLCYTVIYGYYLPIELFACNMHDDPCVATLILVLQQMSFVNYFLNHFGSLFY